MTPEMRAGIVERDDCDYEMVHDLAERHRASEALVPPSWQAVEDRHDLLAALAEAEQREAALVEALVAIGETSMAMNGECVFCHRLSYQHRHEDYCPWGIAANAVRAARGPRP